MCRTAIKFALVCLVLSGGVAWAANIKAGETAPEFKLVDSTGKKISLSESKGKWVVLEWLNHGCPFVRKHYDSGNMQALQTKYTGQGVVWYSVISSAPGKQGYATPVEVTAEIKKYSAKPTAVLLDSDGKVGMAYGAQTTPAMYVINPQGKLAYMGAIDDKATTEMEDVKKATNYVAAALDAGLAGKPISKTTTKSYGCSVKYK
jgi:peroxiredoxin